MATFHLLLYFCFFPSVTTDISLTSASPTSLGTQLCKSVVPIGMEYTCPKFQQGLNKITCKINTTAFDNKACDSLQNKVTFEKGDTKLCYAPPPAASGCSTSQNTSSNPCWCVESDNIFTYTFLFNATLSDLGAVVECKYCITASNTNVIVGCNISSFEADNQAPSAHMIYTTAALLLPVFLSFNFFHD